MHSLIIFASGIGTNAAAIIAHFRNSPSVRVSLVVSNRPHAGVIDIALAENIPHLIVDRAQFPTQGFIAELSAHNPSLIILAGFLWKIPDDIIAAFRNRIVNIHPALLPEHGGKGMYGDHVHNAVLSAGKTESGITIHYVDEVYDNGAIILQAHCPVLGEDDAGSLAERIHRLEHFYYPRTIEFLLKQMNS